jgi:hypothetical protein
MLGLTPRLRILNTPSGWMMPATNCFRRASWWMSSVLLVCLAATGCQIRLISDYDPVLDQNVTSLQHNVEVFLNKLAADAGTPAAGYAAHADFYIETDATLATMATRAAAQPKNTIIVGEIKTVRNTIDDLQKLQQMSGNKGLTLANIANTRSALEGEFQSILQLELALKANSTVPASALAPGK